MLKRNYKLMALFAIYMIIISFAYVQTKPVIYIIGDSTVRNGDGSGKNGQWGWGSFMKYYFDTTKVDVKNEAIGGGSSRTFITEGRWDKILTTLKKGDVVIIQFGHNDGGPLDDTARARGTIRGIGNESKEIFNPITKKTEVVYTYGWYMRKYVQDAKAKGAIPVVCSLIPRNQWDNEKVKRADDSYGGWAKEVAIQENAYFIDLANLVADEYEKLGKEKVADLFHGDHTHTSQEGAKLNAAIVAAELKRLKPGNLEAYLK